MKVYYIYPSARKGAGGCLKGNCYNCPLEGCMVFGAEKRVVIRNEEQAEFLKSQLYKLNKIIEVKPYA